MKEQFLAQFINKDKVAASIRGHDHFALGVAWDPKEEYILTVSSDGSCRFHTSKSRRWKADARTAHIACKMEFSNKKSLKPAGAAEGEAKVSKEFKMFLDDSMAGGSCTHTHPPASRSPAPRPGCLAHCLAWLPSRR